MERLDPGERLAQMRALRTIAHLYLGPRGEHVTAALRNAERDPDRLPAALAALSELAPLDKRHVLATFARLHWADRTT